jgi:3-isopropylmalate/(R)-2-methylmalate dehydratase small subunit
MSIIVSGKVWKFGDNINTDYMSPSSSYDKPWEEQKKTILHIHKTFTEECQPGDVIVAGKNFGCGSSRETAPINLKLLGIGCVAAESFGRIFYRNCIAVAFPVIACPGVFDMFEEGDQLEMDFENALIKNLSSGKEIRGPAMSEDLISIIREGGLLGLLMKENQDGSV